MKNELIAIEEKTALTVFSSDNGLDPIIQQAKQAVSEFEHDLSTAAGRNVQRHWRIKSPSLKPDWTGWERILFLIGKQKPKPLTPIAKQCATSLIR